VCIRVFWECVYMCVYECVLSGVCVVCEVCVLCGWGLGRGCGWRWKMGRDKVD